ncbi:MAG: NAD(P)-binding domain-containing protein [Planctomycetota bacterium]
MSEAPIAGTFAILGATGAVGSTLARHLAARGARLVLLARDEGRLAELAGPLGARTGLLPSCRPTAVKDALVAACGGESVAGIAHCVGSLFL